MYNYKIKFTKKPEIGELDGDFVFELIENYYHTLCNNGQVLGGYDVYVDNKNIFLSVVLPENDSLSNIYANDYVKEYSKKTFDFFNMEIIKEGENLEYGDSCTCENPTWYFLYPQPYQNESPIVCGDCRLHVPLYKLPYISDFKDHKWVLDYQKAYDNMWGLWEHCLWDKFAGKQLLKHDSRLNVEGRNICRDLEKNLTAPFFYYIDYDIKGWGKPSKPPEKCPQCGDEWNKNTEFFKCEKCRLITTNPTWEKYEN